ncbi:MAG: electron transport complex subunit RsxA [Candidatus Margulisbacteria bacterium]|nr:electron transport complex subunit RsxA [Candidatus Margulisiibacteriota bacterium]MBU1021934.1 electron transport complex subunit RsxA [Candidatus Margulisiibacteriota bacterium]MBU1728913.1 electron transport complex subunit RsxA [Candidatus Margulisiibacteriota bacterium]MBU1954719.1 electron transport complex subunit RsxA [Candidatus Margulisiibacteriota bacterium]
MAGEIQTLGLIIISSVLVNNFILIRFLGICPFIGVSSQVDASLGMGLAVVFVMTMASLVTWIIQTFILTPFGLGFLQTIAFILIVASLVQLTEIVINKVSPTLKQSLGIYLPLITTNCAILGVAILNIRANYTFIQAVVNGFGSGIGFTLALLLMAGIRERLDLSPVPKALKGAPITFITAALMSIAFLGFIGLIKI